MLCHDISGQLPQLLVIKEVIGARPRIMRALDLKIISQRMVEKKWQPFATPARGWLVDKALWGGSVPRSNPLHFYIPLILTERVPCSYTYHGKYPLASTGGFVM